MAQDFDNGRRDNHDVHQELSIGSKPRNIDILRKLHAADTPADPMDDDGPGLLLNELADQVGRNRDAVREDIEEIAELGLVSTEVVDGGLHVDITDTGDVVRLGASKLHDLELGESSDGFF